MVLGNPCERIAWPPRGYNPQVENHSSRLRQHLQSQLLLSLQQKEHEFECIQNDMRMSSAQAKEWEEEHGVQWRKESNKKKQGK